MKRNARIYRPVVWLLLATILCLPLAGLAGSSQPEPLKATLFFANARVESYDSDITKAYIKENLGLDFTLYTGVDNWQQRYALLVSSGDIPTLSVIPVADFYEYALQGAYADITDKVGSYPNIMSFVDEGTWPRVTLDGSIYAFPNKNTAGKWNLSYRKDWLDNLGMEVPTTIEEFTEMMRAFTEDDPDRNGVADTYGYGNSTLHMFYGMFGAAPGYYTVDDGVVTIGSISEGYKQSLQYFKELYDAHYVDPEVFTQKGEQFWQKLSQGHIGSWVGWWSELSGAYSTYGFAENQPGGILTSAPAIPGPDGKVGMSASDPLDAVLAISYKASDELVDRILTYIDWAATDEGYRTSRYGVEGVYHSVDGDGNLDYVWSKDPDRKTLDGRVVEGDPEIFCYVNRIDIYPEYLTGDTIDKQLAYEGYVRARDNALLNNAFLGLTTEPFQTLMPDLTKYVDEMRVKFLLGDESFDNWDAYVQQYINLGGLEVAESLLAEYNAMYGTEAVLAQY